MPNAEFLASKNPVHPSRKPNCKTNILKNLKCPFNMAIKGLHFSPFSRASSAPKVVYRVIFSMWLDTVGKE